MLHGVLDQMKRPSRVLVLSNALAGGGAEAVARLMTDEIDGADCLLFENDAGITSTSCTIRKIPGFSAKNLFCKVMLNIWRVVFIQYVKLCLRPYATISHLEGPNFANILTFFGGRKLIFVHNKVSLNYGNYSVINSSKIWLVKSLYRYADIVFCVSPDIREELIDDFGLAVDRTDTLQNPIDIDSIQDQSYVSYGDTRDLLCHQDYLISIASLTPQKNHELLLHAYATVVNSNAIYRDLKLVLVGEGSERERLLRICSDLGLTDSSPRMKEPDLSAQVLFLGYQRNPYRLLKNAKLLIMPSLWEGFPIALLEAMALGVPSIVADCSVGVREALGVSMDDLDNDVDIRSLRSDVGVLVKQLPSNDRNSSVILWACLIKETLLDVEFLKQCQIQAIQRVKQYDLKHIKNLWVQKLF